MRHTTRRLVLTLAAIGALGTAQAVQHSTHTVPQSIHTKAQTVTVLVNNGKYSPSIVHVKSGQMVHMNFKLGPNPKCGDTLIVKSFNINKKLAKGKTTTVMFTPQKPGKYAFTCGMSMYKGTIVAK